SSEEAACFSNATNSIAITTTNTSQTQPHPHHHHHHCQNNFPFIKPPPNTLPHPHPLHRTPPLIKGSAPPPPTSTSSTTTSGRECGAGWMRLEIAKQDLTSPRCTPR
ncbi:hypothetical protein Pcinc_041976, partial [Petrolisthes cinctipes]